MKRAYFSKVIYDPEFGIPCQIQYAEVNSDLFAVRVVEVGVDGRLGYADLDKPDGECGAVLPEKEFPEPDNLPIEPGKFVSEEISKSEFDMIWAKTKFS
ncbi:DUF6881 domain-containing protein [Aliiroseovarius crassostreae]|uniref:DUF6881 domain-containing protein n=1 Tax=Aliiroseovarius crassostreae TaxID=154981 RepID=UPI00220A7202|nr:hypothetical protein [Aliiroseovarius crassostreae]UWQ06668.1 hypothetical protein K3X22_15370 [Aliiroseovarius crassostreae]